MSDRMAARIFIGGKIPEILAEPLCDQIDASGAAPEYDGRAFKPRNAEDLLDALEDQGDGVHLLALYGDEAAWGEFRDLEQFLRDHEISYTRHSDGKYEHDPCIVEYRPGYDLVELAANKNLEPIVEVRDLIKAADKLVEAIKHARRDKWTAASEAAVAEARRMLRGLLPPELPPLESFEIDSIKNKEPRRG